jgi:hypothetical protein
MLHGSTYIVLEYLRGVKSRIDGVPVRAKWAGNVPRTNL